MMELYLVLYKNENIRVLKTVTWETGHLKTFFRLLRFFWSFLNVLKYLNQNPVVGDLPNITF